MGFVFMRPVTVLIFFALPVAGCSSMGWRGHWNTAPNPQTPWSGGATAAVDGDDPLPAVGSAALVGQVDLDLALLVDMAFDNNPEVCRLWHGARAAAARGRAAIAPMLPHADLSCATSREWKDGLGQHGHATASAMPSLEITWRLFSFGSDLATAKMAQCQLQAANFAHSRALQTLLFQVQSAYFSLNAAEATVEARLAGLREAEELLALAESRFQAGLENRQNCLQARAAMLQARHAWEEARAKVEQGRAVLAEVVGVRVSSKFRIRRSRLPENVGAMEDVEAMLDRALRCRPDLLALRAQLGGARFGERAAQRALYPRLVTTLSADRLHTGGVGTAKTATAAIGLSWDLFSGMERTAIALERREDVAIARANLKTAELKAAGEVWTAYQDHGAAVRQLESAKGLVAAADESFHACEIAYRGGLCPFHELLGAQSRFASARESFVAAECRYSLSLASLAYAGADLHCIGQ
ncbi:MAG: TolC family protein [Puniceicoccales bacterium]|nr:TolC family protein [Puniceicoccales bacterium]